MKYGIIGDIHSNLEAFEAVLEEIDKRKIDKITCLGDIVGYGANPNECIDKIRQLTDIVVIGNHDAGSIGQTDLNYFNWVAREACEWTGKVLTESNKVYLKSLDFVKKEKGAILVHASPSKPEAWRYVISVGMAMQEFSYFNESVCFVGHSHVPITFVKRGEKYDVIEDTHFKIGRDANHIINVGSVGQPRDHDPRASFGIYDSDEGQIEIIRLAYDIGTAQQKIRKAGLPEFLATRLALGR
jgi:diadenosine tetraphosphatase ApaH/serine/threonine PP2A family protein phosphatase